MYQKLLSVCTFVVLVSLRSVEWGHNGVLHHSNIKVKVGGKLDLSGAFIDANARTNLAAFLFSMSSDNSASYFINIKLVFETRAHPCQ